MSDLVVCKQCSDEKKKALIMTSDFMEFHHEKKHVDKNKIYFKHVERKGRFIDDSEDEDNVKMSYISYLTKPITKRQLKQTWSATNKPEKTIFSIKNMER
jgi:hypothetical protein